MAGMRNELRQELGTYVQGRPQIIPSGKLWPNGEFSLGYTRVGQQGSPDDEWAWVQPERYLTGEELDARLECMNELLEEMQEFYRLSGELAASGLTLSNVWNSHSPPSATKKGLKGLTGHGTKMLRSACWLLEERLGKDDCVMITLTVPTLGKRDRITVAEQWGVITNRLVQWLSRELVKAGRTPAIAGCVEIQTGRLHKYAQGYLHLHLVCPAHSNNGGTWAIDAKRLRTWWAECLERTIGKRLPSMPRIETAIVEKSVEGYLGKYLSKGTGDELAAFIGDLGEAAVPGQWWFMSAPMRAAIVAATVSGRNAGAIIDAMVNHLLEQGTGEGFEYIRHIDCLMNGLPVTVGYVGRFGPELAADIRAMLRPT